VPKTVQLTFGGQAFDVPLENECFLYITDGHIAGQRPRIKWACHAPGNTPCEISLTENTQVTLGVFSGRPNPSWTLTPAQDTELRQRLDALTLTEQPFPFDERNFCAQPDVYIIETLLIQR